MQDDTARQYSDALMPKVDMLEVMRGALLRSPELALPHSRRAHLSALTGFEEWRAGRLLTKLLVGEYTAQLQAAGLAPATANRTVAAIRWWARRFVDLAAEDTTLAPERRRETVEQAVRASTIRNVKGDSAQRGCHVADGEVRALVTACMADPGPAGTRDEALIAVAYATGMRRAELVGLRYEDLAVIEDGYELIIRHAKGNKTRTVAVYNGARSHLADWLELPGSDAGLLFLAIGQGGTILEHGLGMQSPQEALGRRALQAGVTNVHWQDARRTVAGSLLDTGADLATVQRILGHASPTTTAAYDRRPEETRRKAIRGLHVPYLGGKR